jgi:hypothetical protein
MSKVTKLGRAHPAEPAPGSFRATGGDATGARALNHYPVQARCRICGRPIKAETFLRAFRHAD